MLPEPLTDYNTIFTLLTTFQKQMRKLDQPYTVVTFDQKIYCFAKEIQWKYRDMFDDLVIRLGGMHILLTIQAVIGKMFAESGLEDLLVESNVYGSNTVSRIMQAKAYNRGIRANKLVLEAPEQLQWRSFVSWSVSNDEEFVPNEDVAIARLQLQNKMMTK